ncbi:MAG: replication-associated recombination protein A, partial [Verrucomicrobia bacterium]|nr:replication-associated recombination protein A [Deltaproteobacteria bacterium]
ESGYGKGYQYAHDYDEGYSGQPCLPDNLAGQKFYEPKGHGYEKNIVERMEWLRTKSKKNQDSGS